MQGRHCEIIANNLGGQNFRRRGIFIWNLFLVAHNVASVQEVSLPPKITNSLSVCLQKSDVNKISKLVPKS